MKKKSIIISIVAIALFGMIAWTLANNKSEIDSHTEVHAIEDCIAVTVMPATVQETSGLLELVGMAEPDRDVVVAAESAGKIVHINFQIGDYVNAGTVLAQVDDTYKRLAFENAQLTYNKYKEDYERYQVLRKGDAVSETQLRDMRVNFENASIQLENARKQWDDTRIVAPFGGVITTRNIELGAFVNMGTPIAGMADVSRLKVRLAVTEANAYQLRKGQEVNVNTSVYPGISYKGTITSISPQGNAAHTFPIEITIANSTANPLKAGTYVNARVDIGQTGKALMIPRDAIVSSVKAPSVYVVRSEIVELVPIHTGSNHNSMLEVTAGLSEGDQVVTNGQINLTHGAKIKLIPHQSAL